MNKLSVLVHYRNLLEQRRPQQVENIIRDIVGTSLHLVRDQSVQFTHLTDKLSEDYQNIHQSFDRYLHTVDAIVSQLNDEINKIEPKYFAESYRIYEHEFRNDQHDYVLNRRISLEEDKIEYLHARVRMHGDWKYPGMIIRPGLEPWIHDMVNCDPLYLLDQSPELLAPVLEQFNAQYQNRLRPYTIREYEQDQLLSFVPDTQFGFCLIYNFFNYKPFEVLKKYLAEVYSKLRPGGTLAFTFNDCDLRGGVELVERSFMCYTPGKMVMTLCESLGYTIEETARLDSCCTWVEIRKPGKLKTLRGGQTLARVIAKPK